MVEMSRRKIHKAGAVIIRDRKVLVGRARGSDAFYVPGGKLEPGESAVEALIRELHEEQGIVVRAEDVRLLGEYDSVVAERPDTDIHMDVFIVDVYEGKLSPSAEIEENRWVDSSDTTTPQGSIFIHEVIPRLVADGLID